MRSALLSAVFFFVCAGAHAQAPTAQAPTAQAPTAERLDGSGDRILLVAPTPRLGVDLAGLERGVETFAEPSEPVTAAGPRGARRGAKIGLLVGLGVGLAATAAAFVRVDDAQLSCEWFCAWHVAAVGTVPLAALTTLTGALIGSPSTRNDPWPASMPVRSPRPSRL